MSGEAESSSRDVCRQGEDGVGRRCTGEGKQRVAGNGIKVGRDKEWSEGE